ncbi:MAG: hypothetical protein F4180_06610, partial [Chloroflexi bacterium]|nr:hypothetical protein [Chloroflexota bacterium]
MATTVNHPHPNLPPSRGKGTQAHFDVLPGAKPRILTGIRPTGALHLGHYVGALKNWLD